MKGRKKKKPQRRSNPPFHLPPDFDPSSFEETVEDMGIDLENWGKPLDRSTLIKRFRRDKAALQEFNSSNYTSYNVTIPTSTKPHLKSNPLKQSMRPIFIRDLAVGTTHRGRFLRLRVFEDPYCSPSIHFIVEDELGGAELVGLYNTPLHPSQFSQGTTFILSEPFYKVSNSGELVIRVDHPEDILPLQNSPRFGLDMTCDEWREMGNSFFKAGEYVNAKECYSKGLIGKIDDGSTSALVVSLLGNRAASKMKLKDFEGAVLDAGTARTIDPNQPKSWYREATAFRDLGLLSSAHHTISSALSRFPTNTEFKTLQQTTQNQKNQPRRSWWSFVMKSNEASLEGFGSIEKAKEEGNRFFSSGKDVDAARCYTAGLNLCSGVVSTALSNRAACSLNLGLPQEAIEDATAALVLDLTHKKALFRLASGLLEIGEKKKASEVIDKYCSKPLEGDFQKLYRRAVEEVNTSGGGQSTKQPPKSQERRFYEKRMEGQSTADQLSLMNNMVSLLPEEERRKMGFVHEVPPFHERYPQHRGWPAGVDPKEGYRILHSNWEHQRALPLHKFNIKRKDWDPNPADLVKRSWGQEDLLVNRKIGEVVEEFEEVKTKYSNDLFHSYGNVPVKGTALYRGTVHVAVGFCDLGTLLRGDVRGEEGGSCVWVGVDMMPYAVAKTAVVAAMIEGGGAVESVMEVWYSASWTAGTLLDFKRGVARCLDGVKRKDIGETAVSFIEYWNTAKAVPLKEARKRWQATLEDCCWINFVNEEDTWDACELLMTGDVHARDMEPECGSIVMFNNHPDCPERSCHENAIENLADDEVLQVWLKERSLKRSIRQVFHSLVSSLCLKVRNKDIVIQLICGEVSNQNPSLVARLAKLRPYSVSWSNCFDFIPVKQFHQVARQIGYKDCAHFGTSLNWKLQVCGAFALDYYYAYETRKKLIEGTDKAIEMRASLFPDMTKLVRSPPPTNYMNLVDFEVCSVHWKGWRDYFLSEKNVGGHCHRLCDCFPVTYCPWARTTTYIDMAWSYDPDVRGVEQDDS